MLCVVPNVSVIVLYVSVVGCSVSMLLEVEGGWGVHISPWHMSVVYSGLMYIAAAAGT